MAQSFKWRTEVTEFFAVVLAVVVGLAADEWRQGFQDRALERTYLERLEADLVSGRERITMYGLRFAEVGDATGRLIGLLEAKGPVVDTTEFLDLAIKAGRSGFSRDVVMYGATYDELLATGNLGLIRDPTLRQSIVEHFRGARVLVEELEELPLGYNARFKSLTGHRAARYATGSLTLSPEASARLLFQLPGDERVLAELRHFQAELAGGRFFQRALESIDDLLEEL